MLPTKPTTKATSPALQRASLPAQNNQTFANNKSDPSLTNRQNSIIKLVDIVVPKWYPKKFIPNGERDNAIRLIKANQIGYDSIIVKYDSHTRKYELIKGLIAYKAHERIGSESIRVEVVDDPGFSASDAMLASISYNSFSKLNNYESTVVALAYIVEEMELDFHERLEDDDRRSGKKWKTIRPTTQAAEIFRLSRTKKIEGKKKKDGKSYNATTLAEAEDRVDAKAEKAVDLVLKVINVDLYTFIKKRIPLIYMQGDITAALSKGLLAYNKAIAIDGVGETRNLLFLTDMLDDALFNNHIAVKKAELVRQTIEEGLSYNELQSRVEDVNDFLFKHGTGQKTNVPQEQSFIDKSAHVQEELIQKENFSKKLSKTKKYLDNWKNFRDLDLYEKSDLEKHINKLFESLEKAQKSSKERRDRKATEEMLRKKFKQEEKTEHEKIIEKNLKKSLLYS